METMTVEELKTFLNKLNDGDIKIKLHIRRVGGGEEVLEANRCMFDFMTNTFRISSTEEI